MIRKISLITLFLLFFTVKGIFAQYEISGIVTDSIQGTPIEDARAELYGLAKFTHSNKEGRFTISIPDSGYYTITVSAEGYSSFISTINLTSISPKKNLTLMLSAFLPYTDTIDVNANYFKKAQDISTSYSNTQYEDIRKNPGTFEDVVKYYTSAPGVVNGNDNYNLMLVRGGAPFENLVIIDGFEIPNPNHYGPPGSSNGALSYINSKLIGEVDFFTGGFPARYGDKLSSVMDIKLREGNHKKHIRDLNLSVTGFGGFFEGPISKKGSYMFSARKSYFELVQDQLNAVLLPSFWDFNGKLNYNLSGSQKLTFTGLFVLDHAESYRLDTDFPDDTVDVELFNGSLKYSNETPLLKISALTGYSTISYDVIYDLYRLKVKDKYVLSSQNLSLKLDKKFSVDLVTGLKYYFSEYVVYHDSYFNESNFYVPELFVDTEVKTIKAYAGFNLISKLMNGRLILNTGARLDFFEYMNHPYAISPRFGAVFRLSDNTNITANAGIYFQSPELSWLVTYPENRELKYIRCDQLVLGAEHFIGSSIKISAEGYLKQYYNYPVSVYNPYYLFINNGVQLYPNFLDKAVSAGEGYFTGIDLVAESKNSGKGLFWSASYSYTHSKFLALAGDYQPVEFDVVNMLNLTSGYKFAFGFSVSGHFKYMGGRPYTPYDMELSHENNRRVFVQNYYNKARMPEYVRLDMRIEQELHPWNSDLIIYLEVLNVFNRENLSFYGWNYFTNEQEEFNHFARLPLLGISWKF